MRGTLAGELDLINARRNFLDTMMQFISESDTKGVGASALIIHFSLFLEGGSEVRVENVSPAFLIMGLACICSLFIYLRLPADVGAEVSGRRRS